MNSWVGLGLGGYLGGWGARWVGWAWPFNCVGLAIGLWAWVGLGHWTIGLEWLFDDITRLYSVMPGWVGVVV